MFRDGFEKVDGREGTAQLMPCFPQTPSRFDFDKKGCSVILPALPHAQEIGFADAIRQDRTRRPINRARANFVSFRTFLSRFRVQI